MSARVFISIMSISMLEIEFHSPFLFSPLKGHYTIFIIKYKTFFLQFKQKILLKVFFIYVYGFEKIVYFLFVGII